MKLWTGRFSKEADQKTNDFNSSISFDSRMYQQDLQGSMAHATMLCACGIISEKDRDEILGGLQGILADIQSGKLAIDPDAEDIHTFVEAGAYRPHRRGGQAPSYRTQQKRPGRARSQALSARCV